MKAIPPTKKAEKIARSKRLLRIYFAIVAVTGLLDLGSILLNNDKPHPLRLILVTVISIFFFLFFVLAIRKMAEIDRLKSIS